MMFPPLTDLVALLGIALVLSAWLMRVLCLRQAASLPAPRWARGVTAVFFVALWLPVGAANLPAVAVVRGISSDLSVTLVLLAALGLGQRWLGRPRLADRETWPVHALLAAVAVFLYPLALGWGEWDAYRLGWGSFGLWSALLAVAVLAWVRGLRLLPLLIAAALLAWSAGLLESGNLWDYLLDPWLAIGALAVCVRRVLAGLIRRVRRGAVASASRR